MKPKMRWVKVEEEERGGEQKENKNWEEGTPRLEEMRTLRAETWQRGEEGKGGEFGQPGS